VTRFLVLVSRPNAVQIQTTRGFQAFDGNEEREAANHEAELRSAAEFLKTNIPAIEVDCYYLRFTGVWALEA
jgi:hypothetical protein